MLICIAGGIGSGKSIVRSILICMGYDVYDSDSRAKLIMDSSDELKRELCESIHPKAVDNSGIIDRQLISAIVFSDAEKLAALNSIVHAKVREDLGKWVAGRSHIENPIFVECAIPVTSGIAEMCDQIWEVTAPESIRISRIMRRNGVTASSASSRIYSQKNETDSIRHLAVEIKNDGLSPVLPQIEALLAGV